MFSPSQDDFLRQQRKPSDLSQKAERHSFLNIRFLAPFGGRENWEIQVPVQTGDTLEKVFGELPPILHAEIREKILDPEHPRFGVAVNGMMISKEDLYRKPLQGGEKITLLARLVGG